MHPLNAVVPLVVPLVVLLSSTGAAQARVVSAPPEPSLLNITRQWAGASSLGDLRELRVGRDYLELRAWSGYALTGGTQAVVLRRSEGHWSAYLARVLRCEIQVPRTDFDTASRTTTQRYIVEARRHCGTAVTDVNPGSRLLATDSLVVDPLDVPPATIEDAWNAAQRAGVSDLPPRVQRSQVMDDAFMYVVELRSGNDYRASTIERLSRPETQADQQIAGIYAAVSRLVPSDQRVPIP